MPPIPPTVTVTAASVADSSKFASAIVTITCATSNSVSPPAASVALANSQSFTATFCAAAGTSITWDVNGIVGGNSAIGTIAATGTNSALYTSPADLPLANPVTIHATLGAASASSIVTVTSHVGVSISPPSVTLAPSQRSSFVATVAGTSDASVTWFVNGIPNGNSAVGVVCQAGSNPCVSPPGPAAGSIDYIAPSSPPSANPVPLLATSHADPSQSGGSVVTITGTLGPVSVTISPPYSFLPPSSAASSTQQFFAAVSGSGNTSVTWAVQSAMAGQGCGGTACGSITSTGLYSAPTAAPSPNAVSVIATSQADTTKSASSTVALTTGPVIEQILPSSAIAGAVESIPLEVKGLNFVAGSEAHPPQFCWVACLESPRAPP